MKEDDIEEILKKLSTGKKMKNYDLLRTLIKEGIEDFVITRKKYVDIVICEYRRLQKENEELKIVKSAIQTLQINSIEDEKYIVISKGSFLDGSYKHLIDEYIPVQKIKNKIEELNKLLADIDYKDIEDKQEREFYKKEYYQVVAQIKVLGELSEESEVENV